MYSLRVERYPNREIRLTIYREQSSTKYPPRGDTSETENAIAATPPTCHSLKTREGAENVDETGLPGVRLRPGFGGLPRAQKFSTYGRRQILRAGGALESKYPHSECLFLTLTHPGSTNVSMEALARYSGRAVKLMQDWLNYHLPSKLSIYTWEWQKRGALHLHWVVHCPDRQLGEWIRRELQNQWIRVLDRLCEESGTDLYRRHNGFSWASNKQIVRTDAQWCEKSVAAYLSKYVSKAHDANKVMGRKSFYPSRWYGVSRPLLQLLRELSFRETVTSLKLRDAWNYYHDCLSVLEAYALKCYGYKHKVGSGETAVAYTLANEQDSIWKTIMTQIPTSPDLQSKSAERLRSQAHNGVLLMRKYKFWFNAFAQFCKNSPPWKVINYPSYKDIEWNDLIYLVDMLGYSFRYTQRTRSNLPGECQLWYSTTAKVIDQIESEQSAPLHGLKL